ncbi:hypothetical protein M5D96_014220 [Drosophila gunungcola]|uniref:Sodium-dependent nutrient amino acid transporter 1 n=1 Tax=Drosophila gunungcola TaxID=103775 RepID=A0A9P9Y9S6_9MUSC|nr:hypothetical protein M5D96_014220 [Drosophila gunungcola]
MTVVYSAEGEDLTINCEVECKSSGQRDQSGKVVEFLFSCIVVFGSGQCLALSLHCSKNGGRAFLIPYVIVFLLIGMPVYYLEVIIGQFFSSGCIKAFDMVAIMKGKF